MDLVAIPLFRDEVAPRFCSASEFLLVPVGPAGLGALQKVWFGHDTWPTCLERLCVLGVSVVLCGGFNSRFLPFAKGLGLRVESGLAGPARALAEAFGNRELDRFRVTGGPTRSEAMVERASLTHEAMDDSGLAAEVSGHDHTESRGGDHA
jgi:hypothetical protein